jgi:hypothetical protein
VGWNEDAPGPINAEAADEAVYSRRPMLTLSDSSLASIWFSFS